MDRIILHSDLNCFYASVEMRDNPQFKNVPFAVTGDQEARHGIILAKNEIAKRYGIKTGDVIYQAKEKCPGLITVNANFDKYLIASKQVRRIYTDYTDKIEAFGIDESWLDVTGSMRIFGNVENIVEDIRTRVQKEVGLTVSIGISFNKIFAKLGSDMKKPNGVTYITKDNFKQVVWPLPVCDLLYVGKSTYNRLLKYSIYTIGDLALAPEQDLILKFGKWGKTLHTFACGEDIEPVKNIDERHIIKSIGNSSTATYDLTSESEIKALIFVLAESVSARMRKYNFSAGGIQLYIKYDNLFSFEKQLTFSFPVTTAESLAKGAMTLYKQSRIDRDIRAIGVRAINLTVGYGQLSFLNEYIREEKVEKLERSVEKIRNKWGYDILKRGIVVSSGNAERLNPSVDNVIHPGSAFSY